MQAANHLELVENLLRQHLDGCEVSDCKISELAHALTRLMASKLCDPVTPPAIGFVSPYKSMTSEEFAANWSL